MSPTKRRRTILSQPDPNHQSSTSATTTESPADAARKEREAEAATAKAEADTAKAKADAAKAEADAQAATAKAEAETAKARADAAKAKADARKAEEEAADHDTAAAKAQREAQARKQTAEADKDATAARRAQWASLIPDLSTVEDSKLDVKEGPALFSSFLLGRGVDAAGRAIAGKLKTAQERRVLVTSQTDLATADGVYEDVSSGLKQLIDAADAVLEKTKPETIDEAVQVAGVTPIDTALEAAGAISGAIPAVLSLLSAHRTLSSATVTASDLAAVAAVAGAMKVAKMTVVHDDFRLVPGGGVYTQAANVGAKRQELVARKIALADKKSDLDAELASAKADLDTVENATPPPANQAQQLENAKKVYGVQQQLSEVEVRAGVVDSLLTAADAFITAIRAVPAGGGRSALATAALHEQLHGGDNEYTHVLLVKTQAGQAQQMIDNRPLWFRDKFSTAVEISITYMLIETSSSAIVAAGTESSVQSAHGNIGDKPTVDG